jgi:hypothetical protein
MSSQEALFSYKESSPVPQTDPFVCAYDYDSYVKAGLVLVVFKTESTRPSTSTGGLGLRMAARRTVIK